MSRRHGPWPVHHAPFSRTSRLPRCRAHVGTYSQVSDVRTPVHGRRQTDSCTYISTFTPTSTPADRRPSSGEHKRTSANGRRRASLGCPRGADRPACLRSGPRSQGARGAGKTPSDCCCSSDKVDHPPPARGHGGPGSGEAQAWMSTSAHGGVSASWRPRRAVAGSLGASCRRRSKHCER